MQKISMALRYAPEYWTDIKGFPNYAVSNFGRVKNKVSTKVLKPQKDYKGYLRVRLYNQKVSQRFFIHRLLMEAFCGASSQTVDHVNGVKSDNNLSNLRYLSREDNTRKASIGHTHSQGSKHHRASLAEKDVKQIKCLIKMGLSIQDISKRYSITYDTVYGIKKGRTWNHVA